MTLEEAKEFAAIYHHKYLVLQYLNPIIQELIKRGEEHDNSKFGEDEFPIIVASIADFQKHPYGSPEYDAMRLKYVNAFAIHHKKNRHHPEHFPEGVDGMTLMDLVEMLCDWKAASLRTRGDGTIQKSLAIASEKYKLSPQLIKILENTAKACKM